MIGFLNRCFRVEEMNGARRCPTYLYRWILLNTRWLSVYVHRFVASDWSKDLHDHPKRFISIGLRGRYFEETPAGMREWKAPWCRSFPATHTHSIHLLPGEECWTLVITLWTTRAWGFWNGGRWLSRAAYVGSELATARKRC